jgi:hypothetical protein
MLTIFNGFSSSCGYEAVAFFYGNVFDKLTKMIMVIHLTIMEKAIS